jgi:glycosyltransferase involved in cell wall biosynthesis
MRILYSHRIQSRDGMSVHVEEFVTALLQAGHHVLVVGPSFYAASGFGGESRVVAMLRRWLPGAMGEVAELAYNLVAYRRLARAAAAFKPDIVYERYNLYYLAGGWLARRRGLPLYLEVNSPLAEERARFGTLRLRRLARALERRTWRAATRVLVVTAVLGETIAAAGVPASRIEVVPNGVVLDRYDPRPADAKGGLVTLGFVGFVRPWHGLDAVIRAMASQGGPDTLRLVVVGDGPARDALEQLAATLGLFDAVHFTGVVEHALVPALVGGFDIALQPKVVPYASPLKIFDYMAAGRAIVAPDQPNIREILRHDHTALLFDPDRDGAMWEAIARLAADPALRQRLGEAARAELIDRRYTWRGNAERLIALAEADRAGRVPSR